jgi:hypothetical protein
MEFIVKLPKKTISTDIFSADNPEKNLFMRDGDLIISGVESKEEAEALLAAHNPPAPKEPTIDEKLASVGLSVDDLKVALGI